jgi:hypothetical protein
MNAKIYLTAAILCTFAFSVFADALIDSVNQDSNPAMNTWAAADVGWEYTPAINYTLTGVFTKFGFVRFGDNRTVTVEVYNGVPSNGGRLLRSAGFTPAGGIFSGASFEPIRLMVGHTYFIGFRNVANLAVNTTGGPEALCPTYFSFADDGSYSLSESGVDSCDPILEFYGYIRRHDFRHDFRHDQRR